MVTIKFETEKMKKGQFVVFPTVLIDSSDYSDKVNKVTIELLFGWLNGVLGVSVSWTRKVENSAANGVSDEAKCD